MTSSRLSPKGVNTILDTPIDRVASMTMNISAMAKAMKERVFRKKRIMVNRAMANLAPQRQYETPGDMAMRL